MYMYMYLYMYVTYMYIYVYIYIYIYYNVHTFFDRHGILLFFSDTLHLSIWQCEFPSVKVVDDS